jgi:small-conductance mechanosensitive channel
LVQPRTFTRLNARHAGSRVTASLKAFAASLAGIVIAASILFLPVSALHAQSLPDPASVAATDEADASEPIDIAALTEESDREIAAGLKNIFAQIDGLSDVDVIVRSGVVSLTGSVINQAEREQAADIAMRVAGVVTVDNSIERSFEVDSNLSPGINALRDDLRALVRSLPLFGVALLVALLIAAGGYVVAAQRRLWQWVAPNAFLAELVAGAIRVLAIIAALIVALQILDAATLLGLVLGSAGIIGIAVGFAVRDTVDNYVSSLMLSLRQPFRANDHILIGDLEGRVIRLTSRATVLMTLDGNHLRVPNATVFKANILNYTRNPQRRFEFDLGVDSADDPLGAMQVGLQAIRALPFVLEEPRSHSVIDTVGESSIVLRFFAWVDQRSTDFLKGRSLAIKAAKDAVETAGYELPEPIYRIRVDDRSKLPGASSDRRERAQQPPSTSPPAAENAEPDRAVEKLVSEERSLPGEDDLLDTRRPIE